MADSKLSALTEMTTPTGADELYVNDGGTSKRITFTNLSASITEESYTTAEQSKLADIEALADVTDATNVNAAGAVMESDYDANTILAANVDNTPLPLTVAEQTLVGRITAGNIVGLTATQVRTLLNVQDGATDDQSAAEILTALLTVDGPGSLLDADFLDGSSSAAFATAAQGTKADTAIQRDGSIALTADWDAGSFEVRAQTFESDVATGTAPLVIASTTAVTNLNADMVDGNHAAAFATAAQGAKADTAVQRDGSIALTANWDAGSFQIRAETLQSDVATGTAPLTVASTTVVTNLNADTVDGKHGTDLAEEWFEVACSDENTAITAGTAKCTFRGPPYPFTVTALSGSVTTAPTGANIIIDVNEAGTTIMATNKITIEVSEKTSLDATTQPGITDASLAANAEMSVDFDQVGSTIAGTGVKIIFTGSRT